MAHPDDDREPHAPDALQQDLRAVFGRSAGVPPAIDATLQAAARALLRPRPLPWWRPYVAVAAKLLIAIGLGIFGATVAIHWASQRDARDFDRNGQVDILDAFRMSLALADHRSLPEACDIDRNGRVDVHDVERIARDAVARNGA